MDQMTAMNRLVEAILPISAFTMIVLIIYFIAKYNYQTKKLIIESGKGIEFKRKRFPFFEIVFTIIGIAFYSATFNQYLKKYF